MTDPDGERLNGVYPMRFELYRTHSGGAPVYEIAEQSVQISDGLFDVGLDVPHAVFDGGPL